MPKIRPFKAVIYNQAGGEKLSSLVCPPYDVISPAEQEQYYALSPHNFIHILLAKDTPGEDKYRRCGVYFKDWLKNKILIQDETPAIYFYTQQYSLKGEKRMRAGFVALLGLDEKNASVFAHEHTRAAPKEDRRRLLKNVKANLSPIFVAFSDKDRIISRAQQYLKDMEPFIDILDGNKTNHKVWRIDSPDMLAKIEKSMKDRDIFIADGHHRYEVACAYRDEMKKKLGGSSGEESFNYIMAYFTNTESRDLTILPVHRLVKLSPKIDMNEILSSLREYFDLEEVKDKVRFFFLMEKGGRTESVLGMYKDKKYWLLRLKNIKILDKMIGDKPKEYRMLDVAILNSLVLKNILGLDLNTNEDIMFSHNPDEFIGQVDNNMHYLAFLLNPAKISQITSVALTGNRMPPKSTYFYPKVLSGLVINKFNEGKS